LDSFNTRNLDIEPSLQYDISLDTIEINGDSKHPRIHAVVPKLSNDYYPSFQKEIDKLISEKKFDFFETIRDNKEYQDASWQDRSWDIVIHPVSLYQTNKLISFSIETIRDYSGMSAAFEYDVINYDLENKKSIALDDYFILNNRSDITYMEKIIGRTLNMNVSMRDYIEIGGKLNFSFDDFYVYFYFDKYDILGWGARSVKKKYIIDHINPAYR
jgi:hypothetical protein